MMAFIEKDLLVEQLNKIAIAEGNSKKPIYRIHKWWARRLGSVFRMILLSAFSSEKESAPAIWKKYTEGNNLHGKIVLDPFMGGGTTIVEALRLGCKVIGVDLNPVAWFVSKKEVEPVEIKELNKAFESIKEIAGKLIKSYYSTTCPKGHSAEVMYFFWVKIANCRKCNANVKLFHNYELSHRNHTKQYICPSCMQIVTANQYKSNLECHECGRIFDPYKGVSGRGIFECPECGEKQKVLDAIKRKGTALDKFLHALEGYCDICGRFFKRVDEKDLNLWEKAKREFKEKKSVLLFPHQKIPVTGRSDPRPVNHGYVHYWQMFNERQLLCISILLNEILKIENQNIRELLLIALSDCLDANNMFCKYETKWHKISLFFGLHAYHPIERPTENNLWGTKFGRGTFVKCFEKVKKAKLYAKAPFERLINFDGKFYSQKTGDEVIAGKLVKDFFELVRTDHAALLKCQSSESLSFIPRNSIDAVITDPPYFDNVQYSELSDFFYVWLRLALKKDYLWFQPELTENIQEIVKNEKLGKSDNFFNEGLRKVFSECHRVLKDDALLIFSFHHNQTWAWRGLAQLLLGANFYVSACPIVRSEGKSGFHSSQGNIKYDCIFVCRKRPSQFTINNLKNFRGLILKDAVKWIQKTVISGTELNDSDIFAIIMGKTVEYYTKLIANEKKENELLIAENLFEQMQEQAKLIKSKALGQADYSLDEVDAQLQRQLEFSF